MIFKVPSSPAHLGITDEELLDRNREILGVFGQHQVDILFFAKSRELVGCKESSLVLQREASPKQIFERIITIYSVLEPLSENLLLSLNEDYLDITDTRRLTLRQGDTIAIIPPISGGNSVHVYRKANRKNSQQWPPPSLPPPPPHWCNQMDHVELTESRLEVGRVTALVSSPVCGATSVFIGTTRDNFDGKTVLQLEYEAYVPMAEKKMREICDQIHEMWNVEKVAIIHRIGVVPIEEASIIIAVSSAHRKESLEAVQYAIDTLKATVPIWKKEVYDDNTSSWKENKECCTRRKTDAS